MGSSHTQKETDIERQNATASITCEALAMVKSMKVCNGNEEKEREKQSEKCKSRERGG